MDKPEQPLDTTQRTGRVFVILACLGGLALLTWVFSGIERAELNPNQSVQTLIAVDGRREVTLQRNRWGHYVTSGKINGQVVTFMLDTGASDVSVPERLANELGLRRGMAHQYNTANGVITGYRTTIDRISIGDIELYNVRASINPKNTDLDILLGMSFLNQLEYTQRGDQLILKNNP
jgi:aspartyl protease family protein